MVHVGGDGKDGGDNAFGLPMEDCGEEGTENHKWGVVNTGSQRCVDGGWDEDSS